MMFLFGCIPGSVRASHAVFGALAENALQSNNSRPLEKLASIFAQADAARGRPAEHASRPRSPIL
jgi:hypothetical protein